MDGKVRKYTPENVSWNREYHNRLWDILNALDLDRVHEVGLAFAGGTLCSMRYGEYRKSVDIDFFVEDNHFAAFTSFRKDIASKYPLFSREYDVVVKQNDTHMVQFLLKPRSEPEDVKRVKIEFVCSDIPLAGKELFRGILSLTPEASVACKLIAQVSRGRVPETKHKDLIDLLMLHANVPSDAFERGVETASTYTKREKIESVIRTDIEQTIYSPEAFIASCRQATVDIDIRDMLLEELRIWGGFAEQTPPM